MNSTNSLPINQSLQIIVIWIFLVVSLICMISMLIILLKKGDERKKYILNKSGVIAFVFGIIILVASFIWKIFFESKSSVGFESSPIIYLGCISIVFNIAYLINSRKYR